MRVFTALAIKELRILGRDWHGLLVLFLMPTLFILIMSLAMRDAFEADREAAWTLRVESTDRGVLGGQVVRRLRMNGAATVIEKEGKADFTLLLPPEFSQRLLESPDDPEQPLLTWMSDAGVPPQARSAFSASLAAAVSAVQVREMLQRLAGDVGDENQLAQFQRVLDPSHWYIEQRQAGTRAAPSAVQQNVPGWLVFAMFFVVVPLSTAIIVERRQGTAMRLRAMQIPAWLPAASRLPPYLMVNLLQAAAMLAVGVWLVPLLGGEALDVGGRALKLVPIILGTGVAAIGLALLVASVARTGMQAIALGGTLNLIFGAVGGIMVPKMVMPPEMQSATVISPMSWALEGFWDILVYDGGARDSLPEILALLMFGTACLLAAALVQKWRPL